MRNMLPAFWVLLAGGCCCGSVTAAKEVKVDPDLQVRLSYDQENLIDVPAYEMVVTDVELVNMHPTEPLIVQAMEMLDEGSTVLTDLRADRTAPIPDDIGLAFEIVDVEEELPIQLRAEWEWEDADIVLEPGKTLKIPVKYLPQIPRDEAFFDQKRIHMASAAPPLQLSKMERADLSHLVGEEVLWMGQENYRTRHIRKLNNHHMETWEEMRETFKCVADLLVHTTRGTPEIEVMGLGLRYGILGLPQSIRFPRIMPEPPPDPPPTTDISILQSIYYGGNASAKRYSTMAYREGIDVIVRDCVPIRMSNPLETGYLRILDVAVSHPNEMSLIHFDIDLHSHDEHFLIYPNSILTDITITKNSPIPDDTGVYIFSACPYGVRRLRGLIGVGVREDEEPDAFLDFELQDQPPFYLSDDAPFIRLKTQFGLSSFIMVHRHLDPPETNEDRDIQPPPRDIYADPDAAHFIVSPYGVTHETLTFNVMNRLDCPLRVMYVSMGLETDNTTDLDRQLANIGISIKADVVKPVDTPHQLDDPNIAPNSSRPTHAQPHANKRAQQAVRLSVTIDSEKTAAYLVETGLVRRTLQGSILIRATNKTDDVSLRDWKEQISIDPFARRSMVLEIPFSIDLATSDVRASLEDTTAPPALVHRDTVGNELGAVKALFFPYKPIDFRPWLQGITTPTKEPYAGSEGITHVFLLFGAIPHTVSPDSVRITSHDEQSELCGRFSFSVEQEILGEPRQIEPLPELEGLQPVAKLFLSYNYPKGPIGKSDNPSSLQPVTCHLEFSTIYNMESNNSLPLIIFAGRLDVATSQFQDQADNTEEAPSPFDEKAFTSTVVTGFDKVLSWVRSSVMGSSLLSYLKRHSDVGKQSRIELDTLLLGRYIFNLGNTSTGDNVSLRPILLKVGAISHGGEQHIPLFLTNHNPVPIDVFVDVSEVEGMGIFVDRDGALGRNDKFLSYLPKHHPSIPDRITRPGRWLSHSRGGLRQVLQVSPLAQHFFSTLPFKEAIDLSRSAIAKEPLLKELYQKKARARFTSSRWPQHFYQGDASKCPNIGAIPATYLNFTKEKPKRLSFPGPLLLSDDLEITHRSGICDVDLSLRPGVSDLTAVRHAPVTIPPGGVARFRVTVRAPQRDFLTKDITRFLATGLVLSTDHGQVMPLMVAFEALLGQLKVTQSRNDTEDNPKHTGDLPSGINEIIDIPMGLVYQERNWTSRALLATEKKSSVPLFLRSSFSREVTLRHVESCNPWFQVELLEEEVSSNFSSTTDDQDENARVAIGNLQSVITCPGSDEFMSSEQQLKFPSFYQCALGWLLDRDKLQPHGCGIGPQGLGDNAAGEALDADGSGSDEVVNRAIESLKNAMSFNLLRYGVQPKGTEDLSSSIDSSQIPGGIGDSLDALKSGERTNDVLDQISVDIFAEATDAWRMVSEFHLNSVSSSLKATVHYALEEPMASASDHDQVHDEPRPHLSLPMPDILVRTALEMPRLFDSDRAFDSSAKNQDSEPSDKFLSFLNFPDTKVANVVSLFVPVKNPTSVPVKIRLATTSSKIYDERKYDNLGFTVLNDESVRKRYLSHTGPVYAQHIPRGYGGNPGGIAWWDGDGGFFIHDDSGDLIQSYQNISIKAGPGAHVSLVNPSIYATTSFVVGCGTRCGLKEERGPTNRAGKEPPSHHSPIGASAAAGIALVGRLRSASDRHTQPNADEPVIPVGGAIVEEVAPAAFAVPYSAFDEVILPPYGEADLGPVFFRPPGRFGILGCSTISDSASQIWGSKAGTACSTSPFKATLLLENSLTGLERVVLSGRGSWEKVNFLDPVGGFGDIEYRFGRSALIFSGSGVRFGRGLFSSQVIPVVKEVVVHNGGDVEVEFETIFFSGSSKPVTKATWVFSNWESGVYGCEHRGFRLIGCTENFGQSKKSNLENGLKLKPGESRSIFIEHRSDCSYRSEYFTLTFEYKRDSIHNKAGDFSFSRSGSLRQSKANEWNKSFGNRREELFVGFEMTQNEMAQCRPSFHDRSGIAAAEDRIAPGVSVKKIFDLEKGIYLDPANATPRQKILGSDSVLKQLRWISFFFASGFALAVAITICSQRQSSSRLFRAILRGIKRRVGVSGDRISTGIHNDWAATFRCLGRADPTSAELQSLGREQVRQIVLDRYRSMSIHNPQCINAMGGFLRDRSVLGSASSESRESDKIRTLSDTLFLRLNAQTAETGDALMPCALGWQAATLRGLVITSSHMREQLSSHKLLKSREKIRREGFQNYHAETPQEQKLQSAHSQNAVGDLKSQEGNQHTSQEGFDIVSTSDSETLSARDEDSQATGSSSVGKRGPSASVGSKESERKKKSERRRRERADDRGRKSRANKSEPGMDSSASGRVSLSSPGSSTKENQKQVQQPPQTSSTPPAQATKPPKDSHSTLLEGGGNSHLISPNPSERVSDSVTTNFGRTGNICPPTAMTPKGGAEASGLAMNDSTSPASLDSSLSRGMEEGKAREATKRTSLRPPPGLAPPPGFGVLGSAGTVTGEFGRGMVGGTELTPVRERPTLFGRLEASISNLEGTTETALDQLYATSGPGLGTNSLFDSAASLLDTGPEERTSSLLGLEGTNGTRVPPPLPPPHSSPLMSPRRGNQPSEVSPSSLTSPPPSSTSADQPLLGLGGGFNVIDFLDSILEEPKSGENSHNISDASPSDLFRGGTSVPADPMIALPNNPWAQSRASAFGIALEGNDDDGKVDFEEYGRDNNKHLGSPNLGPEESGVVHAILETSASNQASAVDVPLLTASFMFGGENEGGGDQDGRGGALRKSSFYSQLLGE